MRLFAETRTAYGKLDVLVNNAGIYEFAPLESITVQHFHKQFDLNVLGLLLTTQEAVKLIGAEGGSIINISSIAGPMPVQTASVYSATKAAVDAVTIALSKELGSKKIRVNSLNPGMVETEGLRSAGFDSGDFRKMVESETPLGRIAQPHDIARAAVFLPPTTPVGLPAKRSSLPAANANETRSASFPSVAIRSAASADSL